MEASASTNADVMRMSAKKKVLQTQAEDPVEKVLLGDASDLDLESMMELQLARRRSSLSDAILLYLFIEKIREKERNEIISALRNASEAEKR
jgi:hypothetical protein